MSVIPPFLTDEEIATMCDPLVMPGAQCRYLAREGYLISRKPNGRPLLARSEYERVKNPQPPAPQPKPEWQPPPRPAFEDTPLGRWQRQVRENSAAIAAEQAAYVASMPEPTEEETRARDLAAARASDLHHAALIRFHAAKRRVVKLRRRPAWADMAAIRAIYQEAQRLTRETGIPHHVDHEIPLQGKLVSGLHVYNNLQILTGSENSKKRNRFEIEP